MPPHISAAYFALGNFIFWILLLSTGKKKYVKAMKCVGYVFGQILKRDVRDVFGLLTCGDEKSCSRQPNTISIIPCH